MSSERRYALLGHSHAVNDITDITITSAATGDLLRYNGSAWVDYPDSNYAQSTHTHVEADITDLGSYAVSPVGVSDAGTGITTYTTGDILYASATNTLSKLAAGSDGQVLTLASGVPSWAAGGGGTTTYKTADTTYSSTTTFQSDTHLTGIALTTDSWHKITGFFAITSNSTANLKLKLVFTQTPQSGKLTIIGAGTGGVARGDHVAGAGTQLNLTCDTTDMGVHFTGYVRSNATTGGTFELQHAQNTSDAVTSGVLAGSWIKVEVM